MFSFHICYNPSPGNTSISYQYIWLSGFVFIAYVCAWMNACEPRIFIIRELKLNIVLWEPYELKAIFRYDG